MNTTFKQWVIILVVIVFSTLSCKHGTKFAYPQDENISNESGNPKQRNITFFPVEMASDSSTVGSIDTFHLKMYTKVLSNLGEPILYNFYIGKPVIRLTWFRPSGYPMTLSVEEIGNKIQLKENGYAPLSLMDLANHPKDTIKRIYRARVLNFQQKQKLLELLKKNNFFDMPANIGEKGGKGTELAIEYHDPTNYHLVYRLVKDGVNPIEFREICDYIIDLSNFKEDKRY